jgi:hypothetical protein
VREHEGNGAGVVNLDALDEVLLHEGLPKLRGERGFGEHADAAFDAAQPSGGLLDRKIEATAFAGGARADVPELGELLKARENRRPLADQVAHGSTNFALEGVLSMDGSQEDPAIDEEGHQS